MKGVATWYAGLRLAVLRIQCQARRYIVQSSYRKIVAEREPWKEFLLSNEAICLTSLVVKDPPKGITSFLQSARRRQLILTTGPKPRLIYIDPNKMELKGEIAWDSSTRAVATSDKNFTIGSTAAGESGGRSEYEFYDLLGNATRWVRAVRSPLNVNAIINNSAARRLARNASQAASASVTKQGYLTKRAIKSQKNWRERWFVLQSTTLSWFKREADWSPKGCVDIDADSQVIVCSSVSVDKNTHRKKPDLRPHSFDLVTSLLPFGVRLQAKDDDAMYAWVDAIEQVINKCKTAREVTRMRETGSKHLSLERISSDEMQLSRQKTARSRSVI